MPPDVPTEMEALAAINGVRAELDLPPLDAIPRGHRDRSDDCPVARALSRPGKQARVGPTWWRTMYGQPRRPLPPVLYRFIGAFDNGDYPDLIERRRS